MDGDVTTPIVFTLEVICRRLARLEHHVLGTPHPDTPEEWPGTDLRKRVEALERCIDSSPTS